MNSFVSLGGRPRLAEAGWRSASVCFPCSPRQAPHVGKSNTTTWRHSQESQISEEYGTVRDIHTRSLTWINSPVVKIRNMRFLFEISNSKTFQFMSLLSLIFCHVILSASLQYLYTRLQHIKFQFAVFYDCVRRNPRLKPPTFVGCPFSMHARAQLVG